MIFVGFFTVEISSFGCVVLTVFAHFVILTMCEDSCFHNVHQLCRLNSICVQYVLIQHCMLFVLFSRGALFVLV